MLIALLPKFSYFCNYTFDYELYKMCEVTIDALPDPSVCCQKSSLMRTAIMISASQLVLMVKRFIPLLMCGLVVQISESWSYPSLNDTAEAACRVVEALAEHGWTLQP